MLDIAQNCTNQDTRTFKLQKGEFKLCEAQPIENSTQPSENRRKVNSTPKPTKTFRVLIQHFYVYKKNSNYILKAIERLVSYSVVELRIYIWGGHI